MRIGQRLIRESLITAEQLDEALRIQLEQGGRLGSTLVKLGYVSTDDLARSLGRHYGMPALSSQHIMLASEELHSRLSSELAISWGAIPICALRGQETLIAVAVADPLPPDAVKELSNALDADVVLAIAPEIDINAQLHRIYGMPSSLRIIRHFMSPDCFPNPEDAEYEIAILLEEDQVLDDDEFDARSAEMPIDTSIPLELDDFGDHHARLDEMDDAPQPPSTSVEPATVEPATPTDDGSGVVERVEPAGSAPLGRIAIKRLLGSNSSVVEVDSPDAPASFEAALRTIRLSKKRDQIGSRVIAAMRDFMDYKPDAGALLIARNMKAMGWKAFARRGSSTWVGKLNVPLDVPSVLYHSFWNREVDVGAPTNSDVDGEIWQLMGCQPPPFIATAPVVLDEANVCLLYVQGDEPDSPEAAERLSNQLGQLAKVMTRSFLQLIRASQR